MKYVPCSLLGKTQAKRLSEIWLPGVLKSASLLSQCMASAAPQEASEQVHPCVAIRAHPHLGLDPLPEPSQGSHDPTSAHSVGEHITTPPQHPWTSHHEQRRPGHCHHGHHNSNRTEMCSDKGLGDQRVSGRCN